VKKILTLSVLLAFTWVLTSCGGGDKNADIKGDGGKGGGKTRTGGGSEKGVSQVAYPKDKATGSVAGKVTFTGNAPTPTQVAISDEACKAEHKDHPLMTEDVQIDAKGGLANVFVYIAPESLEKYSFESNETHTLNQKGCTYLPHITGVVLGDSVMAINSDKTSHNVHTIPGKSAPVNMSQTPGAKDKMLSATEVEVVKVKCDVHSWMTSYVHVLPHPKFAVTAADGSFKIEGLLPGKYKLKFWHEKYAAVDEKELEITVEDGKTAEGSTSLKKE
jgi:plastocyanin